MLEAPDFKESGTFGLESAVAPAEHQLLGTIDRVPTDKGTEFQVRFKETGYKERV